MRFLGEDNHIVDCTKQDNLGEKIWEFVVSKEDYFTNFYMQWTRNESEMYQLDVGGYRFDIGTGIYTLAGDSEFGLDWFTIDEIIGRDIKIFTINPRATRFDTYHQKLDNTYFGTYYYPATKNPIPIVSACGEKCMIVSPSDQHRNLNEKNIYSLFVV